MRLAGALANLPESPPETAALSPTPSFACVLLLLASMLGAGLAKAADAPAAGVRIGFGASGGTDGFRQTELVARLPSAIGGALGKRWRVRTALDISVGRLEDDDVRATIGGLGAVLLLAREDLPLAIELGVGPSILGRHEFSRNFGQALQFTSHAGLLLRLGDFRLGYRFQHLSNARMAKPNPGLNQHVFSLFLRL